MHTHLKTGKRSKKALHYHLNTSILLTGSLILFILLEIVYAPIISSDFIHYSRLYLAIHISLLVCSFLAVGAILSFIDAFYIIFC